MIRHSNLPKTPKTLTIPAPVAPAQVTEYRYRTSQCQAAEASISTACAGFVASFISLYSTESTNPRQLASTIFEETPTVVHFALPSLDVISTRTKLAEPVNELLI